MVWQFLSANKVIYKDTGFIVELVEGTWNDIVEICPYPIKDMKPIDQCRLIKAGISAGQRMSIFEMFKVS